MLQSIRDRSSGIIAKIIVGLIAVTFVVTGVNFFVVGDGENVIAEVGSVEITDRALAARMELERRQLLQIIPDPSAIDENQLRQRALAALADEAATQDYANQLGFTVTDSLLDQIIVTVPQFQRDGRFDPVLYDQAIARIGQSRLGFREELKKDVISYQVIGGVETSVMVLPSEVDRLIALQNQTRSGEVASIDATQIVIDPTSFDEAAIETYYQNNPAAFESDEAVTLQYVTLDAEHFADQIEVTEDDVRAAYETEVAAAAELTERRARHILITDPEAGLEKIQALRAEIEAGAAFADVARAHSEDIASRELGGDLGFVPAGTFVAAFEDAINTLPLNTLSEPVQTEFGFHLIEVLEERKQPIEAFSARADSIRADLVSRAKEQALNDNLEDFANIAFSGTLEELRTVYGVSIETSGPITRQGGEGLLASPGLIRRAFDPALRDNNLNAEAFEVEPGVWMTFRVTDYAPRAVQPLEVVRSEVIEALISEAQKTEARNLADQIARHWESGQSGLPGGISSVVSHQAFTDLTREGSDSVSATLIAPAFRVAAPSDSPAVSIESGSNPVTVARVDQVTLASTDDENRDGFVNALGNLRLDQQSREFSNFLGQRVELTRR